MNYSINNETNRRPLKELEIKLERHTNFQNITGIALNDSLKNFYKKYNGGFIALGNRNRSNIKHPNNFDDAAWVGN